LSLIRIEDPDDPRIAAFRDVRERDLVGRQGRFIAEGRVVLEKLVDADPAAVVAILVSAAKAPGLADMLARAPANAPVYVAEPTMMDRIAGFPIHRGVLALGRRLDREADALLAGLPARALVVGLVGIANHDNMGGLFRNAAAFGAAAVLLDPTCCDPLYRKAIRVSVGAALTLPFARVASDTEMLTRLAGAGFDTWGLSPAGAVEIDAIPGAARMAAVFGAEGPGLAPELMARMRTARIDMAGGLDSLNVATAAGVALHRISRLQSAVDA
jgi:tRNA G18 (ribose-2'-O)-methylase SpoU